MAHLRQDLPLVHPSDAAICTYGLRGLTAQIERAVSPASSQPPEKEEKTTW